MKTPNLFALFASLTLSTALISPAYAGGYLDSKHGSTIQSHTRTAVDYAKYSWETDSNVDHIVVSLPDQKLYAYHGGQLVAWSNISSGAPGHDTPTGTFAVSEKDVDHHSSLYDNAPMPYFLRLTDGGVGLHAGYLPGYPASHGCVRLPFGMARELYQHTDSGTAVEITGESVAANQAAGKGTVALAQN